MVLKIFLGFFNHVTAGFFTKKFFWNYQQNTAKEEVLPHSDFKKSF